MKQFEVKITLILDAENENEALGSTKNYLALGVIPEDIYVEEISGNEVDKVANDYLKGSL